MLAGHCRALINLRLAMAFRAMYEKAMPVKDLEGRLAECTPAARPVDLAGVLFLYCGFTNEDHRQRLPGARERLDTIQRPDGGICYIDTAGCASHWHATSLLLELLRMETAKACRAHPARSE